MKGLFIFSTRQKLVDAGFHPQTRLHRSDRSLVAFSYDDLMRRHDQNNIDQLRSFMPEMVVLDSSVTPFMMTLHHARFGSLVAWMRGQFRNTTWIGNWPEWEQK